MGEGSGRNEEEGVGNRSFVEEQCRTERPRLPQEASRSRNQIGESGGMPAANAGKCSERREMRTINADASNNVFEGDSYGGGRRAGAAALLRDVQRPAPAQNAGPEWKAVM